MSRKTSGKSKLAEDSITSVAAGQFCCSTLLCILRGDMSGILA